MKNLSFSIKIYIGLIITLGILAVMSIFLPFPGLFQTQEISDSKRLYALVSTGAMLIVYGGLGFLGLKLSQKLGFANIWDSKISNKQRFLIPALIGLCLGVFLILADALFSQFHDLGALPHPPFPSSIIASAAAGIGEELIFRLFFISFWVWLVSYVILKKRWQNQIFWIITIFSAITFAMAHIPTVLILTGLNTVNEIPPALMVEIFLLNGVVTLFTAYYFRKFGFLAAIGIHFWTDVIWHVIWGLV